MGPRIIRSIDDERITLTKDFQRPLVNPDVTCRALQAQIRRLVSATIRDTFDVVDLESARGATSWGLAPAAIASPYEPCDRWRNVLRCPGWHVGIE